MIDEPAIGKRVKIALENADRCCLAGCCHVNRVETSGTIASIEAGKHAFYVEMDCGGGWEMCYECVNSIDQENSTTR
jgi:hypothetical protein